MSWHDSYKKPPVSGGIDALNRICAILGSRLRVTAVVTGHPAVQEGHVAWLTFCRVVKEAGG